MRLLVWTSGYRPQIGGVEVFLSELAPALRRRGHQVSVLADIGESGASEREEIDGVEVERLELSAAVYSGDPRRVMAATRAAAECLQRRAPDVVHVNFSDAAVLIYLRAAAGRKLPMALTFHVSPPPPLRQKQGALRKVTESADRVAACSRAVLDDALEMAPAQADRARVIPYGLTLPDSEPPPPEEGLVAAAGRLVAEKGFDVLIDALPALVEQVPDARLLLIGDGPERAALEQRARELGVADRVEFAGWVSPEAMYGALGRGSVVAVPSRWREAFGIVAIQASLQARPVVASRVGGLPEAVLDGETGVLVEREDPAALAAELAGLLLDPARADALGRRGRERALAEFSIERSAERYEALFEEIAA